MTARPVNHFRGITQMVMPTAAVVLALLLAGCGGGDPDDPHPDIPRPAVDCAAQPERCK